MRKTSILSASLLLSALCAVSIPAAEVAKGLLAANFDFEAADSASTWHTGNTKETPAPVIKLDEDSPHSGKAALKFQASDSGGASTFIFTGISLSAEHSDQVRLRLYARGAGLDGGDAEINLLERNAQKVIGWSGNKQTLVSIDNTSDWKAYSVDVPIHPDTRVLTLMIRINHPTAQKTLWVDDLSLEYVDSSSH